MQALNRRTFMNSAACGVATGALSASSGNILAAESPASARLPREVWVATVCQAGLSAKTTSEMTAKMLTRMNEIAPLRPDIVCLPEMFHVANLKGDKPTLEASSEAAIGPFSTPIANFARQHHCYVICPISTVEQGRYYNASVVIDREGAYVGEYRKINPTDGELDKGIMPGPIDPPVFELDFGTIGIQTCYDINWHDNWRRLRKKGAEIVFWPSAFAGGRMLNSLAWINKYYVVSSTRIQASKIVDVLGDDIASTGRFDNWLCTPLNLDVAVVQTHVNIKKLDAVQAKYGRKIDIKVQHVEAWARLESRSAEVSIPQVLEEFGLETTEQMFARETERQDRARAGTPAGAGKQATNAG